MAPHGRAELVGASRAMSDTARAKKWQPALEILQRMETRRAPSAVTCWEGAWPFQNAVGWTQSRVNVDEPRLSDIFGSVKTVGRCWQQNLGVIWT